MNEKKLKSLNIKERIKLHITEYSEENYEKWNNTKTLLSNDDKEKMLTMLYSNPQKYYIGIGNFKKSIDKDVINDLVWFDKFNNYIDNLDDYENPTIADMGFAFRFILLEVKEDIDKSIENNKHFIFHKNVINDFIDSFYKQMIEIINKTLIYDMHQYKKIYKLNGSTGERRFSDYLEKRFGSKQSIKEFYKDYPNLVRLMVKRKEYFVQNTLLLISRMNKELKEFLTTMGVTNFHVKNIKNDLGDTHDKGNSVSIIELYDNQKFIYKPKNLEITKSLDEFMFFCNKKFNSDFYITQKLVKKEYCFEEFIEHDSLDSLEDAKSYYFNFGCLLALVYMLNGNDMHHENIIAKGKNPVLIDAETFIQQKVPVNLGEIDATYKCKEKFLDSVMSTAMLPIETLKDRSGDENKGIDISALKSGKEKIPFKILKIININTDAMRYSYETAYTVNENNLPVYQEKEISYQNYKSNIYNGFNYMMNRFVQNKLEIIHYIKIIFKGLYVRHVIRPTQRYKDLLEYSYHPDCMKDAYYRETILQNLWSYPYTKKDFCVYEQYEMMDCDIPQFFLCTDKKSLFSNDKIEIENVFLETPLELIIKKFENLNEEMIKEQLLFIKSSFKDIEPKNYPELHYSNATALDNEKIKNLINNIVNKVIKSLIIDHNSKTVSMIDIKFTNNSWDISVSNDNIYDGLSGVYLLLVAYENTIKDYSYSYLKKYIINTVLHSKIESINSFFGIGSLVYPLLVEYELTGSKQKLELAKNITNKLITRQISSHADWINGSISFVPTLLYLFNITNDKKYYQMALDIEKIVNIENHHYSKSFAHGIEGFNYIQNLLEMPLSNTTCNKKISNMNGWCKGDLGIKLSRLLMRKNENNIICDFDTPNMQNNNTLCHGNMGLIELLIQKEKVSDLDLFDYELRNTIINGLIESNENNDLLGVQKGFFGESLSLFVGISGIAYELMRFIDNSIPNVLMFEFK